jgi:hypothetical protein
MDSVKKDKDRALSLLKELEQESMALVENMQREEGTQRARDHGNNVSYFGEYHHCETDYYRIRTKLLAFLYNLNYDDRYVSQITNEVSSLKNTISDTQKLLGVITGLKTALENGLLESLIYRIEAEIHGDYLSISERLLHNYSGELNHAPAAVLLGAILEDSLRRICTRQEPPVDTTKSNGEYKTLNTLIDDLKRIGFINELKAKQLRAWADIRNSAAHGRFETFTRTDVEQMLSGVTTFLGDYY